MLEYRRVISVLTLLVSLTACGSRTSDDDVESPRTSERTPSTTGPTSTIASATLPTSYLIVDEHLDGPLFDDVEEMLRASELVMTAEVVNAESLGLPQAEEDPEPSEYVALTLRPIEVIRARHRPP